MNRRQAISAVAAGAAAASLPILTRTVGPRHDALRACSAVTVCRWESAGCYLCTVIGAAESLLWSVSDNKDSVFVSYEELVRAGFPIENIDLMRPSA